MSGVRATAAAIGLVVLAVTGPVTAAVTPSTTVPGAQLWAQRYSCRSGATENFGRAIAVAPGGARVFVTGACGEDSNPEYATVAYNTATSSRIWAKRYSGPGYSDIAAAVVVSPNGNRVFVTGTSSRGTSAGGTPLGSDYATIAYNAGTGARLWVARYRAPRTGPAGATAVAVSPNGNTVFVTGASPGSRSGLDYATVAYNAVTGARQWIARYNGPGNRDDAAAAMTVDPGGLRVYVTGTSTGVTSRQDYATVAYSAATGVPLWVTRYNGTGNANDAARAIGVASGQSRVFVTGISVGTTSKGDYVTIAYNAATGARIWAKRYNGPGNGRDTARSLAVTSGNVFVTGQTSLQPSATEVNGRTGYATIAYNPVTGAQRWVKRYNGPASIHDGASAVAANPATGTVYVTGTLIPANGLGSIATIAYNSATGAQRWLAQYSVDSGVSASAPSIAAYPNTGRVFVSGCEHTWMLTVAYAN